MASSHFAHTRLDRRSFLARGAMFAALAGCSPRVAFAAAETDRRFVFIIQRGAADGLSILSPTGDPAFARLRAAAAEQGGTRLDGMFTLHAALPKTAALYRNGQALFAHAIASPYRDRSHFDGQNVLETGAASAFQLRDGWMNRMLGIVPPADRSAIAVAATVPLALRGSHDVASYAPSELPDASDDLLQRVTMLYQDDAQLHALWDEAMQTRTIAAGLGDGDVNQGAAIGKLAATLLRADKGARIATVETSGWDTHFNQEKRLTPVLSGLDAMIDSLRTGLGPVWDQTVVLVATEFGRTAALNGTGGTDHGTGAAAMLLGGAVKGGRIVSDWPGLGPNQLYENRDLRPTMQLDAFIAGSVAQHFGTDPARTLATLFPKAGNVRPTEGLIRT
jgi:uncharacterized protein (DUF1501 family)